MRNTRKTILTLMLAGLCPIAIADNPFESSELWDLSPEELGKIRLTSIASGTQTPLDKAAAVATVITRDDIAAMGATDLDQILETVPGLHVGRSDQAYAPKYTIRGITSNYNPHALLLINGVPITTLFTGNRSQVWGGMPVKAITRVEIIRGPGSALYGADAFSGVINVITKDAKDIDGTTAGIRSGSFDTYGAWLEHGSSLNDFDFGMVLEYQKRNRWDEEIEADVLGNSGKAETGVDAAEVRLEIEYGNWTLRSGYQGRYNIGVAAGLANSLDSQGEYRSDRFNFDLTHTNKNILPKVTLESKVSYYTTTQEVEQNPVLFPPGLMGFSDGIIGAPGYKEEQARINMSALYSGNREHLLRFGLGGFWGDVYETTEQRNFDYDFTQSPLPFTPKSTGLTDVSDTSEVFLPERERTSYYLYVQDEWQFTDGWALTSGIRYDHYSDFGDTTNPRLALVWATTDSITTKALYGRAFRAPSFVELFAISNPVALGNPSLDPEIIDTYEIALSQQLNSDMRYSLNLFYYEIEDFIQFVGPQVQNDGNRKGHGAEAEIELSPSKNIKFVANYSYQKAEEKKSGKDVGEAPNHQLYARTTFSASENWSISPQLTWVGKQKRSPNDLRSEPTDDYTLIDINLNRQAPYDNWELSLSAKNIFNASVKEPSPAITGVPTDYAMPGRQFTAELQYNF